MRIDELKYNIRNALDEVMGRRNRLIIITESQDMAEKQFRDSGLLPVNLNLLLSEKLIDIPINKRNRMIGPCISEIIKNNGEESILAINRFEMLFLPELQQDPIRLFEELSKARILLVFWPGKYQDGLLSYAEPWHREYREYSNIDAIIL